MIEFETDSRKIKPGQTFVAIKGLTVDGHNYIQNAIDKGATKIVVEEDVDYDIETLKVDNTKEYIQEEIVKKYADSINELNIIGVTGTNGKTTTCYLTYQMLNKLGIKTAYIGTIGFYYEGFEKELPNTTPEITAIYSMLDQAKENGCTHVIMEVSSQALEERRIDGLKFTTCAFTNLTQDHLDFHKSMENYLNAKLKIFNYFKPNTKMIVNNDDSYASYFIKDGVNTTTIGYKEDSDILIKEAHFTPINTTINFVDNGKNESIVTNLTSKFNVYNYLTCYAILKSLGVTPDKIAEITKEVYPPKGRCQIIEANHGFAVVDYAHTPDAVEKVINSFLELKKNRLFTIVGCGGDRDPIKRPIMGEIACRLSDHVIFTNDNPRTEDPKNIMNAITKDLKFDNFEIIFDGKEAIYKGIELMQKDDILLILGKGHEDYQILGHEKIHFDDCEVVNNWKEENE